MTNPKIMLVLEKQEGGWVADFTNSKPTSARLVEHPTLYKALVAVLKEMPGGKCPDCGGTGQEYIPIEPPSEGGSQMCKVITCRSCVALFAAARREEGAGDD